MTIKNIGELNNLRTHLVADLLAAHVLDTLADYYAGTGVKPAEEVGLQEEISNTLAICLSEIR